MTHKIVVFCTCESEEQAEKLARLAVERHLAACANIVPGVRSIYRWQGAMEDAREFLLIFKTTEERFEELSRALREAHSYEVPEIVAMPVVAGSPAYLAWLEAETRG